MNLTVKSPLLRVTLLAVLTIGTAGAVVACSDDALTTPPPVGATPGADGGGGGTGETDGGPITDTGIPQKPLYALGTLIFNQTSSTTYISLLDTLDTQADVTTAAAREFAGYAAASAAAGKVIVSDGESPKITRFAIGEDKSWTEETTLGFSNYSQTSVAQSIQVSDTLAYAPFDAVSYVAWNPTTFALGAELPQPTAIPLTRDNGLNVTRGYAHIISGDLAYQTFYWSNAAYTVMSPTSQIGIIDPKTNTWLATPEVPCPHMHIATKDDAGNLYFSPGQGSIAAAVVDPAAPKNCMVKLAAGATTVNAADVTKFSDLAGGREGSNFFYIGNGIGFFNAYHNERDGTTTGSDPSKIEYSANYHLWTYDLAAKTAKMTEGIDYAGGQYTSYRFDGRVFVAIPAPDYSKTTVYEMTPAGKAEKRFETQGWTFHMFKVR